MEKMPIENWISSRLRAAEAMIRSMETHVRLLEKQRDYLKVWKNDQLQILEEQVKHLERQRCFLTLWKPDVHFGLDSKSSHVDVQLVAKDEGRVHAHKAILAARSQEFEKLFRAEIKDGIIEIADMSYEELSAFVRFFYTASIDSKLLVKHSSSLLQAADRYKVNFLRTVCEEALVTNICKENAISIFVVAKKHCSEATLEALLNEATSMGELSTFNEYKQYCQTDAKLLLELYEKFLEVKKASSSKKRRTAVAKGCSEANAGVYLPSRKSGEVSRPAENVAGEPYVEIFGSNIFETMNEKVEADGPVEDNEKGKDKVKGSNSDGGRKKMKDNRIPGRTPMPFDTPMVQGSPYGSPHFMPFFMPPCMPAMYPGNPMLAGQRPPMLMPSEPSSNFLKPLALKKEYQTKKVPSLNKKSKEANVVSTLPQGIVWKKKQYRASIVVNGKTHVLGNSKSLEEATHMYDRAAYVCGRGTNHELPEKEKQELEGLLWEEFLDFPRESQNEQKQGNSGVGELSSILPQSWLEEY
ncbi:uncharacterized protein [Physcomitrium patens]|uniref:uncharacterized protein isoform X3 n=1 Tax=Physcomitrium patens TaxID=3218 RepID=UPI000D17C2AD|nr:uncharacterized protein LOC112290207 isoform X3 [Physcomitrium patens]|eukprot:XP_024392042.1 uncharacterized protein LOC112290207 isoform X3 [Physcomitrella patens]